MPNHLANEKSPYLLQHADNPVDWRPWGEDAFRAAREQDKPIFLSVGYATCHWCHVMAHESFEDREIAELLNEYFISIKVDREERPDVDQVYMTACQALTGHGGWPLSVFMTPDKKPFFAGTYFPRTGRMGMPGFRDILIQFGAMWAQDRSRMVKAGEEVASALQPVRKSTEGAGLPGVEALRSAYGQLKASFSDVWGGFGGGPKFPTPHHLTFLLRWHLRSGERHALEMVEKTLDGMRSGGMFDHLGFGFHRYSVDERWLVPHFEKMLYDQALLVMAYTEAFLTTGKEEYARVAREVLGYTLRDMTSPEGGFYSAEDADSEGHEGLFYVWRPEEVKDVLGEEAGDVFCHVYDISSGGNFENSLSIPHMARPVETYARQFQMTAEELDAMLTDSRARLFARREGRVHPFKDDKILTAWNGLMIAALSMASQAFGEVVYADAARRAADFILERMRLDSGRLLRRWREGEAAIPGYADDYAFFVWGLIELYQATFEVRFLEEAMRLNSVMIADFWDEADGGFFYTDRDGEALIVREKDIYDGAVPSANSVGALNLLRLSRITGLTELEAKADRLLRTFSSMVGDYPSAYTQFLNAVDFAIGPSREVVVVGNAQDGDALRLLEALRRMFSPNSVLMLRQDGLEADRLAAVAPFTEALQAIGGKATAYICENYACGRPVTNVDELEERFAGSAVRSRKFAS